jgi:peptidoglycan/LPS O-acetylase OafA/YrhL
MHFVNSITELQFFRGSWVFVEFFFVLSGFVLTHSLTVKGLPSFRNYITLRFFRIYPLHLVMLLIFIALQLLKLYLETFNGFEFENEAFSGKNEVSEIIPNLLLIQAWTSFTEHSFNYPSWSVSIEFYLYILLYLLLFFFKRLFALAFFSLIFISCSWIYFEFTFPVLSVKRGVFSFFSGCLLYLIYKRIPDYHLGYFLGSVIEVFLLFIVVFSVSSDVANKLILMPVLFMVVIFFYSKEVGVISKFLKAPLFQKMGELSYSIYMVHAAIIYCFSVLTLKLGNFFSSKFTVTNIDDMHYIDLGGTLLNNLTILLLLVIIYSFSVFTYSFVEKPAIRFGRSKVRNY